MLAMMVVMMIMAMVVITLRGYPVPSYPGHTSQSQRWWGKWSWWRGRRRRRSWWH